MFKKLRKNEKGFTLAELLIVVAIIGVLVAISIPIFTSQLEKSREAVDAANLRAAYAEVMSSALTDDLTDTKAVANVGIKVDQKQTKADWQSTIDWPDNMDVSGKKPADGASDDYWTVKWDNTNSKTIIE